MKCTIKSLRIIFETHILIQNKKLPQLRGVFPDTHSWEMGKTGKQTKGSFGEPKLLPIII